MLEYIVFKISKWKKKAGNKLNELAKDGWKVTSTYGKKNRWIIMEKEMIKEPKPEEPEIKEPEIKEPVVSTYQREQPIAIN